MVVMVMARSLALLGRAQSRASIFARDSSELGDVSPGTLLWLCKYRYRIYHHRYLLVPNRPPPPPAGPGSERLMPHLDKSETVAFCLDLIRESYNNYGQRQFDYYQWLTNGIVA